MNINLDPISKREKNALNEITEKILHFPECKYGTHHQNIPIDECLCDCYELYILRYGMLMERFKYIGFK